VASIASLNGLNDPRLEHILEKSPKGFGEHIHDNSWARKTKQSIIESIRNEGQINANFCYKNRDGKWDLGPGQTRWLSLYYLKIPTQKVVVCVKEDEMSEFEQKFGSYDNSEITDLSDYFPANQIAFIFQRAKL